MIMRNVKPYPMEQKKIIQLRWFGRFGNRMFQYVFGCAYAKKFNCTYYIPSEWEGTHLFRKNKYCQLIPNDALRLCVNQTLPEMTTTQFLKSSLAEYNAKNNDTVEFVDTANKDHIGKDNIAFNDLNCMYFSHCFDLVDDDLVSEIFTFNDVIVNSDVYKWYLGIRHTYDVVHLRRGDVSWPNFSGHYSMISKASYLKLIRQLGLNNDELIWISDDANERTKGYLHKYHATDGHKWSYPYGEEFKSNTPYFFDFLPDFLLMIFARRIIRGNSSFAWWAACLGDAEIYSPVIMPKPMELREKFFESDAVFEKGNHPHFVGSKQESSAFNDIIFANCIKYKK